MNLSLFAPTSGAVISPCGLYRYRLWRDLGLGAGRCLFVCLNGSTADATTNDPSVRRMMGFARQWGFRFLDIGNLFGWRSIHPEVLPTIIDPIGPENDEHVLSMASAADRVIVAWGNHGKLHSRGTIMLKMLREYGPPPRCFRITNEGQPEHPLYQRADAESFEVPT